MKNILININQFLEKRLESCAPYQLPLCWIGIVGFPIFTILFWVTEDFWFQFIGTIISVITFLFLKIPRLKDYSQIVWYGFFVFVVPIDFTYGYLAYPTELIYAACMITMLMTTIIILTDILLITIAFFLGFTIAVFLQFNHIDFNLLYQSMVKSGLLYAFILSSLIAFLLMRKKQKDERVKLIVRNRQKIDLEDTSRKDLVGEIIASIAHEINQPLCSIKNYVNGILRRTKTLDPEFFPDELSKALHASSEQIDRAGDIIHTLKEFYTSKGMQRTSVDIDQVICRLLKLVDETHKEFDITVNFEKANEPCIIKLDKTQLEIVIMNLIRNAQDAVISSVNPNRVITIITSHTEDSMISIKVIDSGDGVPESIKNKLFLPFVTSKEKGTGLGLSLCYNILQAYSGTLVHYVNQMGTVFEIRLPINNDD